MVFQEKGKHKQRNRAMGFSSPLCHWLFLHFVEVVKEDGHRPTSGVSGVSGLELGTQVPVSWCWHTNTKALMLCKGGLLACSTRCSSCSCQPRVWLTNVRGGD